MSLNRRIFVGGALALGAGGLSGCAGGGARKSELAGPLNADGAPKPEELMKPGPLEEIVLGNSKASDTIIEYASLSCPFCYKFHKETFPRTILRLRSAVLGRLIANAK